MAKVINKSRPTVLVTHLSSSADEVFGNHEAASAWLDTPLWELNDASPREIVTRNGQQGFDKASDVLLRIEYGVYS